MNKFDKARKDATVKKFATYQFKVPRSLWDKFKIKSITLGDDTYGHTLEKVIEEFVST